MKSPVNRKSERNLALFHDWRLRTGWGKRVFSVRELMKKYGINSRSYFYRIIQDETIRELLPDTFAEDRN